MTILECLITRVCAVNPEQRVASVFAIVVIV